MSFVKLIEFSSNGDHRGQLVSLEQDRNIPFDIQRVYYIFSTKEGVGRGFHAHIDLKQVAICVKGSCRFVLDNGEEKQEIVLDSPTTGIFIDSLVWREMHDFSHDCVLMVIASELYDESDYIRDYDDFLELAQRLNNK